MRFLFGCLVASLAAADNLSCIQTKKYSGRQCRHLKAHDQKHTMGQVCVQVGESPDTIQTIFEVTDPLITLESARVWIGASEEVESMASAPTVTKVSRKQDSVSLVYPLERKEKETNSQILEVLYHHNKPFHTCPSCEHTELEVMATVEVTREGQEEPVTLYGYEEDHSTFLSFVFGDTWIGQAGAQVPPEDIFEGFPIHMTCDCQPAGLLRRGRRRL